MYIGLYYNFLKINIRGSRIVRDTCRDLTHQLVRRPHFRCGSGQNRHVICPLRSGQNRHKPSITIAVHLNYFSKAPGHLKFKYNLTDTIWVDLETLISSVTMSYNEQQNVYILNANDAGALTEFISSKKNKK